MIEVTFQLPITDKESGHLLDYTFTLAVELLPGTNDPQRLADQLVDAGKVNQPLLARVHVIKADGYATKLDDLTPFPPKLKSGQVVKIGDNAFVISSPYVPPAFAPKDHFLDALGLALAKKIDTELLKFGPVTLKAKGLSDDAKKKLGLDNPEKVKPPKKTE